MVVIFGFSNLLNGLCLAAVWCYTKWFNFFLIIQVNYMYGVVRRPSRQPWGENLEDSGM